LSAKTMQGAGEDSRWPDLEIHLRYALQDLVDEVEWVRSSMVPEAFEKKFKAGEKKYKSQWLDMTEADLLREVSEELLDAVVYLCMRRYKRNEDSYYTDLG